MSLQDKATAREFQIQRTKERRQDGSKYLLHDSCFVNLCDYDEKKIERASSPAMPSTANDQHLSKRVTNSAMAVKRKSLKTLSPSKEKYAQKEADMSDDKETEGQKRRKHGLVLGVNPMVDKFLETMKIKEKTECSKKREHIEENTRKHERK